VLDILLHLFPGASIGFFVCEKRFFVDLKPAKQHCHTFIDPLIDQALELFKGQIL
jgi:hypothetical protein